jgi:hypothetical protein
LPRTANVHIAFPPNVGGFWRFFFLFWQSINATFELLMDGDRKEAQMDTQRFISGRKPLYLALIAGGAPTLYWYRTPIMATLSALRDQQAVSAFVRQFGVVGPVVLFGLLVGQVVLAVVPGLSQAVICMGSPWARW